MSLAELTARDSGPVPFILDSDGGSTDAGDYQMLTHAIQLHKTGKIKLLGVCVTCGDTYSAPATRAQLNYFGLSGIPVGAYQGTDILAGTVGPSLGVKNTFAAGQSRADSQFVRPEAFYRNCLAGQADGTVVLCMGGFANSFSTYLNASPRNVADANRKLKMFVGGGGQWPNSSDGASPAGNFAAAGQGEWNFGGAGSDAEGTVEADGWQDVIDNLTVPVIFHGTEICGNVGNNPLLSTFISHVIPLTWNGTTNPIKSGYGTTTITSWDPMTLEAAYQLATRWTANEFFKLNQIGAPTIDKTGVTAGQNTSSSGTTLPFYYLTEKVGLRTQAQWRVMMRGKMFELQPADPDL